MKKLLCLMAVLALLLVGCGAEAVLEETTDSTTQTQTEPETTTQAEDTTEEWAVLTPPLDYEIINGFAKTPTHYYAPHDGGIVRAPIGDIARQEMVPLPGSHEGMKLRGAEICGITEEWLFVNLWEAREKVRHEYDNGYYGGEEYESRSCVTYRIALENWETEALAVGVYPYQRTIPWYNPTSDSLLFAHRVEDTLALESMPLSDRKRAPVLMDSDWPAIHPNNSWWRNTLDDQTVLQDPCFDTQSEHRFYVFDEHNRVQLVGFEELSFPKRWYEWDAPEEQEFIDKYSWLLPEYDDDQGNSGYGLELYGNNVMLMYYVIYSPPRFQFLYDPATGARFPAG